MTDLDRFENKLQSLLRDYVDESALDRPAWSVVDTTAPARHPSRSKRRWMLGVSLGVSAVLALVVVGAQFLGRNSTSSIPVATVSGRAYGVSVARALNVTAQDLRPYGEVSTSNYSWAFASGEAFALEGVDPEAALVVRARPDIAEQLDDEGGPWGDYLLLTRGNSAFPALCTYFDLGLPGYPSECTRQSSWELAWPSSHAVAI